MTAAESDADHRTRALRAEIGDLRYALAVHAEKLEEQALAEHAGDITRASTIAQELAHSAFWFRAYHEASRQNRVLREEIARMKEPGRG